MGQGRFEIEYKSTADERYDTADDSLNNRTDALLRERGVSVLGTYGGTALGEPDGERCSDNGWVVSGTSEGTRQVALMVAETIGRDVSVREILDDCPECSQRKHPNCTQAVLNSEDQWVECPCQARGH